MPYGGQLIDPTKFERNVSFENQDMRNLNNLMAGEYDFVWSSCALEHLGSLEAGIQFIQASLDLLKLGGIAVHTTEYNVGSNADTLETGDAVIYRRMDIEKLEADLKANGHYLETLNFDTGSEEHDLNYDRPPYYRGGYQHVKFLIGGYISTSIILVVRKTR
jgi:hypothetical protein